MNLKAIRQKIQTLADHKATNLAYLDELDALINDAYNLIWAAAPWEFAYKEIDLKLQPDLTSTMAGPTATVADYERTVTFSASVNSLTHELWQGNWFEIDGKEHRVLKVVSDTVIHLDKPFRGTGGGGKSWTLKKREYALPQDCVDVASIRYADQPYVGSRSQPLVPLHSAQVEVLSALENRTGSQATHYVKIPGTVIPSGEYLDVSRQILDVAESNISSGSKYEFCWAFVTNDGIVGALSESLIQTATSVGGVLYAFDLALLTWDKTPVQAPAYSGTYDAYPNPFEGWRKVIYFNANFDHTSGRRLGIPKWVMVNYRKDTGGAMGAAPVSQYDHQPWYVEDDVYEVRIRWKEMLNPGNPVYIEQDGQYGQVKFFPRPQAYDQKANFSAGPPFLVIKPEDYFASVKLRYQVKPPELAQVTDSPRMPYDMHGLVSTKAMEDLCNKLGNTKLVAYYTGRYQRELETFKSKYVSSIDTSFQQQANWGGTADPVVWPFTPIVLI